MRSTRNTETAKVQTRKNTKQDENAASKMCPKTLQKTRNVTRSQKRQVLADRTNSGSDLNQSVSCSSNEGLNNSCDNRPKRRQNLPSRFMDHEVSPIVFRNKIKPDFSSTPLPPKPRVKTRRNTSPKVNKSTPKMTPLKPTPKLTPLKPTTTEKSVCYHPISPEKPTRNTKVTKASLKSIKHDPKIKTPISANKNLESPVKSIATITKKSVRLQVTKDLNVSLPKQSVTVNKKVTNPIYKKLITTVETQPSSAADPLALYEFELDPTEEANNKKKRIRKKGNPIKRKKPVKTDFSKDNAAMKDLVIQLKKIQEAALLKKLTAKKRLQNDKGITNALPLVMMPSGHSTPHIESSSYIIPTIIINQDNEPMRSYSPGPPSPLEALLEDTLDEEERIDAIQANTSALPCDVTNNRRISCFIEGPIANSSIINSTDPKPAASPWRVNCGSEIKKWPCNFYVKPSMTPAYQRDTFHILGLDDDPNNTTYNDSAVGTTENIPITQEPLPVNESAKSSTNWKQTSILSFYEESFKKTKKKKSESPKKAPENYNFDEYASPKPPTETQEPVSVVPVVDLPKVNDNPTVDNCFGFDDSAEFDQENISPVKHIQNINMIRGGGPKNRARKAGVLKEINQFLTRPEKPAPMRVLRVMNRNKNKVAAEVPSVEKVVEKDVEVTVEVNQESDESNNESQNTSVPESSGVSQSDNTEMEVALFEDLVEPELVHFPKPSRRSYERRKRTYVRFQANDHSESESLPGDESDLEISKAAKKKDKKKKKNVKTKKEEKEAAEWAAGFNSMLEEVDEFALVIE